MRTLNRLHNGEVLKGLQDQFKEKRLLAFRGALRYQIRSFFEHRSKGGGGHFHVQKFWSKFCMILKAFWQHKIDIKRLFKGRNVKILG